MWEKYPYLFCLKDLRVMVGFLVKHNHEDILKRFMFSSTTIQIIKALSFEKRLKFMKDLIAEPK